MDAGPKAEQDGLAAIHGGYPAVLYPCKPGEKAPTLPARGDGAGVRAVIGREQYTIICAVAPVQNYREPSPWSVSFSSSILPCSRTRTTLGYPDSYSLQG